MAVKWSTPGIGMNEQDNTVRPNAEPGDGIGACVVNANRGYPNQRVLCTTIDKFHEFFGTPDNPNQYGHFAAQVYFEQGGATQLLAVRATMGDEGYAQIQFPYADSIDKNHVEDTQSLGFVDNEILDNIKIVTKVTKEDIAEATAKSEGLHDQWLESGSWALRGQSEVQIIQDIFQIESGNTAVDNYVFRKRPDVGGEDLYKIPGKAYRLFTDITDQKIRIEANMFAVPLDLPALYKKDNSSVDIDSYFDQKSEVAFTTGDGNESKPYYETILHIGAKYTLNRKDANVTFYAELIAGQPASVDTIIKKSWNHAQTDNDSDSDYLITRDVYAVEIVDWDDGYKKNFVVTQYEDADYFHTVKWDPKPVYGIQFTEYGTADSKFLLVRDDVTATLCSNPVLDKKKLRTIADEYGLEVADISTKDYAILTYTLAKTDDPTESIDALVVVNEDLYGQHVRDIEDGAVESLASAALKFTYTWTLYKEFGATKTTIRSTYGVPKPREMVKPWQVEKDFVQIRNTSTREVETTTDPAVNKLIAISSTEVFADASGIWNDGYTPGCETDAEPGNGDIEMYQSNKTNQLIIGAIGPGEFGNNVGISIITPEAAQIPALYGQNAFSWLYRYDDEDKVNAAGLDYRSNKENLTWKKVYKINVYVKAPSKTESVWGFGLDALMTTPVESWLVSNDPSAKDENGNSLWAPYVINGKSNYIYVSKKSVEQAVDYKGAYQMPDMTWSIYQMTGGTNSKLDNVKEKTRALDLFKNRKKATFDYLFNVEPIESFSSRQRYKAMQDRIAQIAMSRKMDLGIIQATSKEAKTIRLKLSEGKTFSYADGSYVAAYDDYDRYFDPFTSTYVMLPRSVAAAVACCFTDVYAHPWDSPAGTERGLIKYSDRPMTRLDDDEFGQLYDIHINSTMNYPFYGDVIMGQKTMLKKESALNRVDIRKLCNYIEKHLEGKLLPYLYQKNTPTVRSSMKTAVDTFMGRIKNGGGILSKNVDVIPDPSDTHLVYVNIEFIPAEAIERIEVTLILNRNTGSITPVETTSRI